MSKTSSIQYALTKAQVWYLEMNERPGLMVSGRNDIQITLLEKPVTCAHYRKLYYGVGESWNWLDRMIMDDAILYDLVNSEDTEIFIMDYNQQIAGYVELTHKNNFSEIRYFGLFPEFVGKGFGKYFLQWGIQKAWSYAGTEKVLLNTCSLDHANALSVYKSCGFSVVKQQEEERKIRI